MGKDGNLWIKNKQKPDDIIFWFFQDIVSESSSFDLVAFIPLLRERIYTQNQFARQFIVSWVSVYKLSGNYKHKNF